MIDCQIAPGSAGILPASTAIRRPARLISRVGNCQGLRSASPSPVREEGWPSPASRAWVINPLFLSFNTRMNFFASIQHPGATPPVRFGRFDRLAICNHITAMNSWNIAGSRALLVSGLLGITGCAVDVRSPVVVAPEPVVVAAPVVTVGAELEVGGAPPPPVADVVVASPGVGFVYLPGAWVWEGRWVWTRGHWDRPPRAGMRWAPHHYEYRNGRHVFVRGGWR